ncbi:LuxR C-terminal-related transcriptional regulator [Microbulbifer sp. ALW1]|uniref:LuxR C-terminal-related transcriptional regulator n=1 Tax=Microbulbifer sp. (strain ALW1) TaxID=1516059 RepID=UPI001357B741|nr:LuxR C-terminal-related transcriptional regulator [Microbulbifer sp. ALW1]
METMDLQPEQSLIHRAWCNVPSFFASREVAQQRQKLDQFIASVFSSGACYYYVLDFFRLGEPMLVSPSVETILGLDPQATTIQSIIERGHPDDLPFASSAEETALYILRNQIGMDRAKNYKISYSGRLRVADGSYRLFNHQALILDTDDEFGVARVLGIHTDITHLTKKSNYKLSLLNMLGGESFLNIDVFADKQSIMASPPPFTAREMDVITLLAEGKTSAVIADALNISTNTVKNHRKNILQKADCKTTGQLMSKCISEGLI